jgi:hypothetical protein
VILLKKLDTYRGPFQGMSSRTVGEATRGSWSRCFLAPNRRLCLTESAKVDKLYRVDLGGEFARSGISSGMSDSRYMLRRARITVLKTICCCWSGQSRIRTEVMHVEKQTFGAFVAHEGRTLIKVKRATKR